MTSPAVRQRQQELHEVKEHVLNSASSPCRHLLDPALGVVAAGFSYGAATASLEVVTHPQDYTACILLDGWFHIEVGEGIDFPKETHDTGEWDAAQSRARQGRGGDMHALRRPSYCHMLLLCVCSLQS